MNVEGIEKAKTGLVFDTERGESALIGLPDGRAIYVTFVELCRGHARLRFEAPTDVQIVRYDLLEKMGGDPLLPARPARITPSSLILTHRRNAPTLLMLADGTRIWVTVSRVAGERIKIRYSGPPEVRFVRHSLIHQSEFHEDPSTPHAA